MAARKIIIGNWKMNPLTLTEAKAIFSGIKARALKLKRVDAVVCPPALYLANLASSKLPKMLSLGAQDVFYESNGTFTGEINADMIKNIGARYAIIGHSERRILGETDEIVNKKVVASLRVEIKTILCVGEKTRDGDGDYLRFLKNQITVALWRLPKKFLTNLIIAYEPVWEIGKSYREAMKGRDVHEMVIFIRKVISDLFGNEEVLHVPILYGGSTSPQNTEDIIRLGQVDGLLVGRESLNPKDFGEMLRIADDIR